MPQTISISADSRAAIKARILELNQLALDADTQMRNALKANNQDLANQWRQRRDGYNAESKKLTDWLNNPSGAMPNLGNTTRAPAGLTPDEEKRLAKIPYDIKYAEQQLAKGDTRYKTILQNLKAEQADLIRKQAGGSAPDPASSMTPEEIKKRLAELPYKIQYAEKMLAEYRRYNNAQKIAEWAQELQNLETEQARLSAMTGSTGNTGGTGRPPTTPVAPPPTATTPPVSTPPAASSSDFIRTVADTFNTNNNQDYAHNTILAELLGNQYSAANIPVSDPKAQAYAIVRQSNSAPLHWIRNQSQAQALLDSLPPVGTNEQRLFPRLNLSGLRSGQSFFIRDFMQVYSQGNLSVVNTVVVDDSVYSGFARDFDAFVERINRYQNERGRTFRVLPFMRMAHRDAIQLIPDRTTDGIDRFGGAMMSNVSISGNVIFSDGALQGIFATDGAFRNLHIRNNHLQIGGEHTISISGMLSGSIMGNGDINNTPLADSKIALYPLRLGGGANVYILGFRNKPGLSAADPRYYQYETVLGVPPARDFRQQVTAATRARSDQFYRDVDMIELHALIKRQNPQSPAQWHSLMQELAGKGFARQVTN